MRGQYQETEMETIIGWAAIGVVAIIAAVVIVYIWRRISDDDYEWIDDEWLR